MGYRMHEALRRALWRHVWSGSQIQKHSGRDVLSRGGQQPSGSAARLVPAQGPTTRRRHRAYRTRCVENLGVVNM
eukprot:438457-Pyramimonas_sp.AAC.1